MPQKVLAGRAADPHLRGDLVQVKVDQVILSRAPARAMAEALAAGMKKTSVEVAVAYDATCVTDATSLADARDGKPRTVSRDYPQHNVVIARPGIGFPAPVHLERFAAPARLALTDDPRMASVGGIGMLALVVSPSVLGQALATGSAWLRPPRSVQIHLTGKIRPFVCARDVALELLRKGLSETVQRIEKEHDAPVVLELAGPSARLLSVSERAVLCGIAPHVGAAAALFVSDEKTEVFLRDQRRSKAHRALVPDPGAPCEEVISVDLSVVDPLLLDEQGTVRPVRDLAGTPVSQVVLGGDSGATLRDMLAAAQLLKSKRVPSRLDLLVAPASRQVLEVLAQTGALVDLVATGARILEPDHRIVDGSAYPPPGTGLSLRTADPEPRAFGAPTFAVASAETVAYAVATGAVGDPRSFKRPVRVTVPRALPTDDVLVLRDKKGDSATAKKPAAITPAPGWKGALVLDVVAAPPRPGDKPSADSAGFALVLANLEEVRAGADPYIDTPSVRAVIAPFIPSGWAAALASEGVAVLAADDKAVAALRASKTVALPAPSTSTDQVNVTLASGKLTLRWLAKGAERGFTVSGTARVAPAPRPSSRGH